MQRTLAQRKCQLYTEYCLILEILQHNPVALQKESSSSSSSSEEESETESSSSGGLKEVEASAVKFHESKPQKPELGAYTEEIDSSAVRIRENKALNSEFAAEEIDSSSVKIREPTIMHGHITKAPTRKVGLRMFQHGLVSSARCMLIKITHQLELAQ